MPLTIDPANVAVISGQESSVVVGTLPVLAGQVLAKIVNVAELSNSSTVDLAAAIGIASNSAEPGQTINFLAGGQLNLGPVLRIGESYYVSQSSGLIIPYSELVVGDFVTLLGLCREAEILTIDRFITGQQLAA